MQEASELLDWKQLLGRPPSATDLLLTRKKVGKVLQENFGERWQNGKQHVLVIESIENATKQF